MHFGNNRRVTNVSVPSAVHDFCLKLISEKKNHLPYMFVIFGDCVTWAKGVPAAF